MPQSFPLETLLQNLLPITHDIFARHGLSTSTLESFTSQIEHFKIHVSFLGTRGSGKTSLLGGGLSRPHLNLVELTVFESVNVQTVAKEADRFANYCLVVNVEEKKLNPTLHGVLKKLASQKMPISIVFTKTDVLGVQENMDVVKQVTTEVTRLMGYAPMAVATTSAKKKNFTAFASVLDMLEAKAERVFASTIGCDFLSEVGLARKQLMSLADHDNQSDSQLRADINVLTQQMQACLQLQQ